MSLTDPFMKNCALSSWRGNKYRCRWCNLNLPSRRRRWCSEACGREAFANHWFSAGRKLVKRRDAYRCTQCGSRENLEVDHVKQAWGRHSKCSCVHHIRNLRTLCHTCHVQKTADDRAKVKATGKRR